MPRRATLTLAVLLTGCSQSRCVLTEAEQVHTLSVGAESVGLASTPDGWAVTSIRDDEAWVERLDADGAALGEAQSLFADEPFNGGLESLAAAADASSLAFIWASSDTLYTLVTPRDLAELAEPLTHELPAFDYHVWDTTLISTGDGWAMAWTAGVGVPEVYFNTLDAQGLEAGTAVRIDDDTEFNPVQDAWSPRLAFSGETIAATWNATHSNGFGTPYLSFATLNAQGTPLSGQIMFDDGLSANMSDASAAPVTGGWLHAWGSDAGQDGYGGGMVLVQRVDDQGETPVGSLLAEYDDAVESVLVGGDGDQRIVAWASPDGGMELTGVDAECLAIGCRGGLAQAAPDRLLSLHVSGEHIDLWWLEADDELWRWQGTLE